MKDKNTSQTYQNVFSSPALSNSNQSAVRALKTREPSTMSRTSDPKYSARGGRLIYHSSKGDRVIADFEARIVVEHIREDDTRTYHIKGETRLTDRFELEIDAADFESAHKLKAALGSAAGPLAAVRARMACHLAPAVKSVSRAVESIYVYQRTGWFSQEFLIPGYISSRDRIELPECLPYELDSEAEVDKGCNALEALINSIDPEKSLPVVTFTLTGPLARKIPLLKRYAFFIRGRTGSLKTSFAQVVMCIWGSRFLEDRYLLKMGEGMTRNAAMKIAGFAADLPILFDNYKPTTGLGARGFINLTHNILEGGEKARLDRNSNLKDRAEIYTWPLFTGEDLPETDAASLARVLSCEFEATDSVVNTDLSTAQRLAMHLPSIGRTWLDFLDSAEGIEHIERAQQRFQAWRESFLDYLRVKHPGIVNPLRVASNLASNALVFEIASHCPHIGEIFDRYREEYENGLNSIASQMAGYTSESFEAHRFLTGIKSLVASEEIQFHKRLDSLLASGAKRVGWYDDDGYYIILDVAIKEVDKLYQRNGGLGGLSKQALCSQLDGLGLVAQHGSRSTTRSIYVGSEKRRRVLHLKKSALEEPRDKMAADEEGGHDTV